MESDEKYLERKFGRQNHFTVPEGYLQNLTASVMANVGKQPECDAPENETVLTENKTANTRVVVMQPWWRRTRVRIAAAAACLLLAGGTAFYTYSVHHAEPASNMAASAPSHNVDVSTSASYNEIADYTMLDNDDIYSLLASN